MVIENNIDTFLETLREKNIFLRLNENNNLDIECPRGALENGVMEAIKANREVIIGYLSNLKAQRHFGIEIPPAAEALSYPLSSAQMRLWLSNNIREGAAGYTIKSRFELEGNFDIVSFERAILRVIEKHEILRTVFRKDAEGAVRQWILQPEEVNFKLAYYDISDESNSRKKAENYIEEDSRKRFDLEKAPLFRVILFRLATAQYLVYYNMHHIITDAWSMDILARDILTAYESFQKGLPGDFTKLRIQYKDYAVWQQKQLEAGALDSHRQYWLKQFQGELPVFDLSLHNLRPPVFTSNGYVLGAFIKSEVAIPFKKLCLQRSGSLFMGLMAALNALFYRYSGQNDIILGTPVAGREHADLQEQIGFYINTLPLRTRFDGADSFTTLMENVRTVIMQAYAHQSFPFDRLVEELQLKRDPGRSILFDVFVNFESASGSKAVVWAGSKDTLLQSDKDAVHDMGTTDSKFDLIFNFHETDDEIYLAIEYNSDLYSRENIVAMIGHYRQLLTAVVSQPETALRDIHYLPKNELQQLLQQSAGVQTNYPRHTVVDMFEWQAHHAGDNIALIYQGQEITHSGLNERSNQLAHYLLSLGNTRELLVPVCMHRSVEMVIAVLGILKAGGAYIPVDPDYPGERIAYIMSEINSNLVITDNKCRHLLPGDANTRIICLDTAPREMLTAATTNPGLAVGTGQPAYIIYTSGSTGVPKGVQVEHGSLGNYLHWVKENYMCGLPSGNMGLFTSLSFDLTITSMFGPLISGKTLYIYHQETPVNEILVHYLGEESGMDIIKLTPAHLRLLSSLGLKTTGLKKVIVGGEQLHREQVEMLQTLKNNLIIYNEYGPTESTVGCTVSVISNAVTGPVNIGKPVANTSVYILDKHLQLVPAGVAGELYIGGGQLARGYWNKPDLTKESFIPHPFNTGERLYRTGDIGRWLPDGNIEYTGRMDEQVKIRGYRIEPGEIESSLLKHPQVNDAVVIVRTSASGEKELVCLVKCEPSFNVNAVRLYLKNRLPEYMIPNIYVQLNEFPLTVNGKIDRLKLTELADSHVAVEEDQFEMPANEVEQQLVEIWKKVLMIYNDISVTANFFELGGHSIRAIKMLTQVSQQFGVSVSVKSLFEEPTIRNLADKILNAGWVKSNQDVKEDNREYEKIRI